MSITCKFQLSRTSNIYYSGEEIAGTITLCSLKQRHIEAITLEFYGQSTLQWWEFDKTKENIMHNDFSTHEVTNKTLYKHQQKHVCEQLDLATSMNCTRLMAHIEYTFHFCFNIPAQVPATLHCPFGQTEYGLCLQLQHAKKVNKEFHQRIVVKNKLDLSKEIKYTEPCKVFSSNEFGQIELHVMCSGFTPGQKIPCHLSYQAAQADCKLFIQLHCITTCCFPPPQYNKSKRNKRIVSQTKHLSHRSTALITIPLNCQISSLNQPETMLAISYNLEAILINAHKKVLLTATVPLTIGTTPCYRPHNGEDNSVKSYLCYDNLGSSSLDLNQISNALNNSAVSLSVTDDLFESLWMLPIKRRTYLRKSLRYCYKKLIKLI